MFGTCSVGQRDSENSLIRTKIGGQKKKRGICSLVLFLLGVCIRPFTVIRHYNNLCVFVDISMAADSIGEIVFYLV